VAVRSWCLFPDSVTAGAPEPMSRFGYHLRFRLIAVWPVSGAAGKPFRNNGKIVEMAENQAETEKSSLF
jgi:hypothetical protein